MITINELYNLTDDEYVKYVNSLNEEEYEKYDNIVNSKEWPGINIHHRGEYLGICPICHTPMNDVSDGWCDKCGYHETEHRFDMEYCLRLYRVKGGL